MIIVISLLKGVLCFRLHGDLILVDFQTKFIYNEINIFFKKLHTVMSDKYASFV